MHATDGVVVAQLLESDRSANRPGGQLREQVGVLEAPRRERREHR
jgi:hypothetical protein